MKTYRHFYDRICDFENLYVAYRAARRAKRDRAEVYHCGKEALGSEPGASLMLRI